MPTPRVHIPVLSAEVLAGLRLSPGDRVADGTLGAGGHTRSMAEVVGKEGLVVSVDRDPEAVAAAEVNLKGLPVMVAVANYTELPEILAEVKQPKVKGILLDLGLSSDQLDARERGFSFQQDGPLDMRFNPEEGGSAAEWIAQSEEKELADLIYQYGEERFSRRIARAIVQRRQEQPIRTTGELAQIVRRAIPGNPRAAKIDPATRTFQALRIAVNDELGSLKKALRVLPDCLERGGRLAIISFHSLEDRPVKEAFRSDERLQVITKKPMTASEEEIARNPRSRSAKLRIAERIA
ncbi:Ribosomal RNA small subunit methyltransferase H [Planctomycetales bacterium 10988]|nr:Ribosomal RNA small subunit methyltransferase H [Planctomycetales bacterium 10988]